MTGGNERLREVLRRLAFALLLLSLAASSACAIVPQNRRQYLADRTMPAQDDGLERRASRKFHTSREGAAGADGKPAGGGCSCGN
ncbi:MAG TPA: DUF4266 domain-containing protein [Polyangiaceae bacterium]|nr:DUF4266 domain-containing protein [Polyangiaceae bacterium]